MPSCLSGGQRQRIDCTCLGSRAKLVVCDESVSALDRSVQAQVLNLLNDLKKTYGFTYLFIAHDLEVVRMSDRILYLQNGKIIILDEADVVYQQIRDYHALKHSKMITIMNFLPLRQIIRYEYPTKYPFLLVIYCSRGLGHCNLKCIYWTFFR